MSSRLSVWRGLAGAVTVALPLVFVAACGGSDAPSVLALPSPITLAPDSASNPTVAYDPATGRTYVAWVGVEAGENAVFLVAVDSTGAAHAPVRVNDIPGDAAPHLQAPAQVAVGPQGEVYVVWQNNTPVEGRRFPASDLRLAVSTDRGRSFRPAITVNDDAGGPPTSHTFHDIAVAADGTVYVSWIDSRGQEAVAHQRIPAMPVGSTDRAMHGGGGAGKGHGGVPASHDHGAGGEPSGPEIRVARSTDGGRSFSASVVVDSAACPCCRTSLALGPDGSVYVAWRKIFPGDVRDIVVARAGPELDGFSEPVRVHEDGWVFPGCPHAGPSLAVDAEGRLLVGWYTGREGRQGLWYTHSGDGGRSFAPPMPILTEEWVPPSLLRLAAGGARVWAVWDDRTDGSPRVRVASGPVGGELVPVEQWQYDGSDPALAVTDGGAVVSWLRGASALAVPVRLVTGL